MELDAYQGKAAGSFAGHPVKLLAAYGALQVLEEPAPEGAVIVKFPNIGSAHAWLASPLSAQVSPPTR